MLVGNATEEAGRLPSEANDFIGRAAELCRVDALLRGSRLVTLVGPGGVGKTRVARRAMEQAAAGYPDGVVFVPLSQLLEQDLLPHTVARQLDLPEQSRGSQLDAVLTHLRDQRVLLVLDTCEHIIDACALFAEAVITETEHVTVLATSREPLDVTGESCYILPRLGLPGDDTPTQGTTDAIELFAQRAAAVLPGFTVNDANRSDVIRLCRRLDGMPLAIELAAVRLRALPLAELADRIDQRLDRRLTILTGGSAGGDTRHRTLRDAIGWSYDLCTAAEQALWARLSVFAGGFSVEAAEAVCAGGELSAGQIFDTVIRLVDKSVITRDDSSQGQPTQYKMLDTIREFGADQLASSGIEADVRNRFVARYLSMARYFGEHVVDDDQLDRFRELQREHANLGAALGYTLDAADGSRYRDGAELAIALYGYWHMAGLLREGKHWLDKVLERFGDPSSSERGWALVVRGYLGAMQGEADEAVADATAGTKIGEQRGDPKLVGRGYCYLTLGLTIAGRYDEARSAGAQAEQRLQRLNDRAGLRILDVHLAHVSQLSGDPEGALRYAAQVTSRFGEAGESGEIKERWAQGWAYAISAMALYWDDARHDETVTTTSKALLAKHELGDVMGMAYCLEIHGWLAARADRPVRAAWLLGAARPLWDRAGGMLGGTAALLEVHEKAMGKARAGFTGKRFDAVLAEAGRHPVEQLVAFAVSDADEPTAEGTRFRMPGQLTFREAEIADLAARGMSNRQIAEHLFISKRTVDAHLDHIYAKLGISSRVELLNALQLTRPGQP
ncbi:MAG TPA: LuxR C-terminal-related transcriptional regulator [Trebonia sp.]|jgi:non-specific serine/threonine protein kinase|nr:LuxR C-terminal-related transcriptional regulator [Trebonia sp.]